MKNLRGLSKQGFTLIEVLIVVVIIGVLAALVIPRMMNSPEKAKVAEAYQMLGALIRAQQARMDTTGVTTPANFLCPDPPSTCTPPSSLGLGNIIQKNFRYQCNTTTDHYCVAARWTGPVATLARWYTGPDVGKWYCQSGYVCEATGAVGYCDTGGCRAEW